MLVDEHNHTGMGGYLDKHTNWMQARGGARARVALRVRVRVGAVPDLDASDVLRTASPPTHHHHHHQDRFPRERVSMPVPILLAITDFTRRQIGDAKAVTLTSAAGTPLATSPSPHPSPHL